MEMDPNEARARAKTAIETMKELMTKERYKDASKCIKMAMEVYPTVDILKAYGFGLLIISETLHYGNINLSICDRFHLYSVLHLHPSSTQQQVLKRFNELKKELLKIKNTCMATFPGAKQAEYLLNLANAVLHYKALRAEFDSERKDCVFLDWPPSKNMTATLRESYLNWKPPVYHVDATTELRTLKRKAFDEIPQNQRLVKHNTNVCQGMILSSEFVFTKLCEEIRNLVDIKSFWKALDGFDEQLSQLKKMGYNNVEKVSERIDILKGIADSERASRAAAEKFEDEVRVEEAKVINLQAAIKKSKDVIANRKSKIETLKKDSSDAIAKFASTAKSNLC